MRTTRAEADNVEHRQVVHFRDSSAAEAGGYVLAFACVLVALGLVFYPISNCARRRSNG